jgi:acetyl esterase/lipase
LYFHGGGFLVGSPLPYRLLASQIASTAGCDVAVVDYRLAPEHTFPAARDDALDAYRALLATGVDARRIAIAGDSAGGNLAAVTLLNILKLGLPSPAAAVLLSPWTDLTGSGASVRTNADRDAMLPAARMPSAARLYAGSRDLADPDLSPLFGDWRACPPLTVHVGSGEILLHDSVQLVERAKAAGVDATLRVWPDMPHVFPAFSPLLPEARAAVREIASFLTARFGS